MCRAMGPTYAWVFPHRGKPDGPAHHPESPFYKREKPRSNGGTISRTTPRRQLCGSGARRTGSTSARPEVTVLLSTGGVDENAGYAGIRPTVAQSCTNPAQKRPVLGSMMELIAVGTPITGRPPHRTVRAAFLHTAPTSDD